MSGEEGTAHEESNADAGAGPSGHVDHASKPVVVLVIGKMVVMCFCNNGMLPVLLYKVYLRMCM